MWNVSVYTAQSSCLMFIGLYKSHNLSLKVYFLFQSFLVLNVQNNMHMAVRTNNTLEFSCFFSFYKHRIRRIMRKGQKKSGIFIFRFFIWNRLKYFICFLDILKKSLVTCFATQMGVLGREEDCIFSRSCRRWTIRVTELWGFNIKQYSRVGPIVWNNNEDYI